MFFTECERLAERHPDLAVTVQQIDEQLARMRAGGIIRASDLASFLGTDPNQVIAVLEKLAREKLLLAEEMVECTYCGMAAPRCEYEQQMEEEGEYCCTSCGRLLADASVRAVTAYRRGEKWKDVPAPPEAAVGETLSSPKTLDENAWYTPDHLARVFNVGQESLRKRLERFRKRSLDGWKENEDRRPREPKYLYQLRMIRPIIDELLRASSERPAK